jgi:hypothetical protein
VSSNSILPYLGATERTSSRQPTVSSTTANSAEAPLRSPAPVSTQDRSGVGGSSGGQDEQSRIVLPPETGEQPSLLSGLRRALALTAGALGPSIVSLNTNKSSSSSSSSSRIRHRVSVVTPAVVVYHCSTVFVFITAVPITKLFAWGEGDRGGHVRRKTTSRSLCGLVCPSRTSERGGKGDCVKEGERTD